MLIYIIMKFRKKLIKLTQYNFHLSAYHSSSQVKMRNDEIMYKYLPVLHFWIY